VVSAWSDGGAATHLITAPAGGSTYTATFVVGPAGPVPVLALGFEEGTGSAVLDASGAGNHGTIAGAARTAAGRFGAALSFDGADDWVTVPDAASLDLTTGMTLSAWVFPTSATGAVWRTAVLKEAGAAESYSLYARTDAGGGVPQSYVAAGGINGVSGTSALAANAWSHLAVTYSGSALTLYVNGAAVANRALTGPIAASAGALRIGGNAIWGEFFLGRIDEVRVYSHALTVAQIQTDMNTPIGAPTVAGLPVSQSRAAAAPPRDAAPIFASRPIRPVTELIETEDPITEAHGIRL
jgi:hypothetical protein